MTFKPLAAALVSLALLAGCASNMQDSPKQTMGQVLGAIGGGLLGAQVGGGKGRMIAVGVGAVAGSMLGSSVGSSLDELDRMKASETTQESLEFGKSGTTSSWSNPDSGNSGSVTPTRTYQTADQQPCREYSSTVVIDGVAQEAVGTACREPDGTWRIVN
ncbi:MAG: RT0821/Lpp0805 family surface protein [Alphaproteobacteria bacterium]|nr:RT0821/Lpp0805 family surface protein [Rhodospirillales bacterium]MCW9046043.1 RT0821/Lpp0805 family surface protein [Alphaproteobacteria bacterium]